MPICHGHKSIKLDDDVINNSMIVDDDVDYRNFKIEYCICKTYPLN